MRLIIDSHLDLAWNALSWKRDLRLPLDALNQRDVLIDDRLGRGRATVSLPELRRAGVAICFATLMARVPRSQSMVHAEMLDYPAPEIAYAVAHGQLTYYRVLEQLGEIRLIRTRTELVEHWSQWQSADDKTRQTLPVGVVLAMEGCDAIVHPEQAEYWYNQGLRFPALVHYGTSAYAVGTGEEGPLPAAGREILIQFQRLGMVLDLTHLSDESFWQVVEVFHGRAIASHQNCRHLVPGQRQFSDDQIRWVIARDGVLGSALDAWMLHPGWTRGRRLEDTTDKSVVPIDRVVDHMDHICQLAGNCRHIAIGSDLDGGFGSEQTPAELTSIADLQLLESALAQRGYRDADIDAIFHGNWLRILDESLP